MHKVFTSWRAFCRTESGSPAIEAGILFPMMLTMICGMMDVGVGIIVNMKVSNATQVVSDLVSRDTTVSDATINDAIIAGRLAMMPYDTDSYGIDVAGIQYIGTNLTPTVQWRRTQNMEANANVLQGSAGLGAQNEGVVAVTVTYNYEPFFAGSITDDISMSEESYVRGRKGLFISKV